MSPQLPTFRFVFRVRERAFVLAFGPLCGWLLIRAFDGFDDQFEQKALRGDPGWSRIFLDRLPPDSVLEPLASRGTAWDLGFKELKNSPEKRDDALEREFVQQYASAALQHVQSRV